MYRTALRTASRPALRSLRPTAQRRFASTSPADKPRSWKGSALRWGLAGGVLYYYNTSSVFAEEPAVRTVAAPNSFPESDLPTVDSVLEEKRSQIQARLENAKPTEVKRVEAESPKQEDTAQSTTAADGVAGLEEEAGQQGAFNPETGEINWDCPCLGGMAQGPCGEEFKTAFSCFVYSEAEPKGMDCIEKFQGMQDCFRQYPEIYGAELSDEAEEAAEGVEAAAAASPEGSPEPLPNNADNEPPVTDHQALREEAPATISGQTNAKLETDNLPGAASVNGQVPSKWEDATAANLEVEKEDKKEESK